MISAGSIRFKLVVNIPEARKAIARVNAGRGRPTWLEVKFQGTLNPLVNEVFAIEMKAR